MRASISRMSSGSMISGGEKATMSPAMTRMIRPWLRPAARRRRRRRGRVRRAPWSACRRRAPRAPISPTPRASPTSGWSPRRAAVLQQAGRHRRGRGRGCRAPHRSPASRAPTAAATGWPRVGKAMAEGAELVAALPASPVDRLGNQQRRDRQIGRGQLLGAGHHVGLRCRRSREPQHVAGAAEAADHLVGDQQHVVACFRTGWIFAK